MRPVISGEMRAEILKLIDEGVPKREIARRFEVSAAAIRWQSKHLPVREERRAPHERGDD